MSAPLKGIKVLELARVLAGPWAGQVLSDLGAEVIKVESPIGDETRKWGPPFVEGKDGPLDAAYFHSCNRGKRSIVLDFKNKDDLEAAQILAEQSDVIIENFKVNSLKKFRLDYESLSSKNHGLIYCSITGFGQTGPYSNKPGYDYIIQALSGIMDLTGEPENEPQKMGVAFADIFTGLYGVIAIQSALKVRDENGKGQNLDLSLMDSMTAVLANQASNYFISGTSPTRLGNRHPNIVPYQPFPTKDGYLIIAIGNNLQFLRLCEALNLKNLVDNPEYDTNEKRVKNREQIIEIISLKTKEFTRQSLQSLLDQFLVPVGRVNKVGDALKDPQVKHRNLEIKMPHPKAKVGNTSGLRTPINFSKSSLELSKGVPLLGEHTEEILAELKLNK